MPCADADTVQSMRAKGPVRVLVLLLAVSLPPVLTVSAHHGPQAKDVVAVATNQTYNMACQPASGQQVCTDQLRVVNRRATITPDMGPLESVTTTVNAVIPLGNSVVYTMQPSDQTWNMDLHWVGCADADAVGAFIADLGSPSSLAKTLDPTVAGECAISGLLALPPPTGGPAIYTITSRVLPPAFPTPTPTPTQIPTPTPTPKPTATPTTATARPTATPGATATRTATGSATESESASASESATASASATSGETPEQSVLGITFTPEPSSAPPAPAGGGDEWAGSVPSAGEISTDATKLAGSGLAALLLLLAMGFIGELFNNTFESNYDRILAGWRKSWLSRLAKAFSGLWGGH